MAPLPPVVQQCTGGYTDAEVRPVGFLPVSHCSVSHCSQDLACESLLDRYEQLEQLGAGVYGTVYKGRDQETNQTVAIKKLHMTAEYGNLGVPTTVLREVMCLRDLLHPNIVQLLDVDISPMQEYSLIFEHVAGGDLYKLLKSYRLQQTVMPIELVSKYAYELLDGIHACHAHLILHRDLKPHNILLGPAGLKIADFGLSRVGGGSAKKYTKEVLTLWYRAPEILLGCENYGSEVDMWSAGCIIAEMATGQVLFAGDSEIGTLFKIFKVVGTPTEETWPGLGSLHYWRPTFPQFSPTNLQDIREKREELGPFGMDLLQGLLQLVPQARVNARRAKTAPFVSMQGDAGTHGGA